MAEGTKPTVINKQTSFYDSIKTAPKIIMNALISKKPDLAECVKIAPRIVINMPRKLGIPKWLETNLS